LRDDFARQGNAPGPAAGNVIGISWSGRFPDNETLAGRVSRRSRIAVPSTSAYRRLIRFIAYSVRHH
jgi:hypothetical protein